MELLLCTATLPVGSGQRSTCNALSHCLGAVGSGSFEVMAPVPERTGASLKSWPHTGASLKSWPPCVSALGPH